MPVSNSTLSRHSLEDTARRICESRGGKWSGTKGMACCPAHGDRTPSLSVSLGQKAILFHCFAGCDQQSVLAALASEGVDATSLFSGSATTEGPEPTRTRKPSAAALRIWREAQPLRASPAKAYLENRGILAASSALRFHPQTPLGPKGRTRFLPAMIAAVSLDEGPIAIHRTFLSTEASTKATFDKPKRALGSLGEAAVRLFAPVSGKLGLAEGIESAMSAYALTGIPVWATLGNERFAEGFIARPEAEKVARKPVDRASGSEKQGHKPGSDATTQSGDNDGDPRRLTEKQDAPARQRGKTRDDAAREPVRNRRHSKTAHNPEASNERPRGRKARGKQADGVARKPAQSELPLTGKDTRSTGKDGPDVGAPRVDLPDPEAGQRPDDARGKADQAMQEEQQRSLLGGAARQGPDPDRDPGHDHDLGDYDPDL